MKNIFILTLSILFTLPCISQKKYTPIEVSSMEMYNHLVSGLDKIHRDSLIPDGGIIIIEVNKDTISVASIFSSTDKPRVMYWGQIVQSLIGKKVSAFPNVVVVPYYIRGFVDRKTEEPPLPRSIEAITLLALNWSGAHLPGMFITRTIDYVHYGPIK